MLHVVYLAVASEPFYEIVPRFNPLVSRDADSLQMIDKVSSEVSGSSLLITCYSVMRSIFHHARKWNSSKGKVLI